MIGNIAAALAKVVLLLSFVLPLAMVWLFGHMILVLPARENPKLCVRRRFMCWLGVVGVVVGAAIATATTRGEVSALRVLFGVLVGVNVGMVLGNVVGRIAWLCLRPLDEEVGS
jgi:hypothetical protein